MKRLLLRIGGTLFVLGIVLYLFFLLSPYPSVWLIRQAFNKEGIRANAALEEHVPEGISTLEDISYDTNDKDAFLDAYYPTAALKTGKKLPVIVWTHGGGLISGSRKQVANYCKLLAAEGYLVIAVGYSIAPEKKYPTPIRQLNNALTFIASGSHQLPADTSFVVLAGDSGGAMLTAATAALITNPTYAQQLDITAGLQPNQLKGLLLFCGIYDISKIEVSDDFGGFMQTVSWAYLGEKNIEAINNLDEISVPTHITATFPSTFITAGNGDPLEAQSKLLSNHLQSLQVKVDTLFYPVSRQPALGHEYQFTYNAAGQNAFRRTLGFLEGLRD
ncbi:alpha/beta hydrolase [Flavobacterium orientale]|uniref:Lipase LipA n=1 Tax=Flavobacterium orientale TaxID=1756020 RepID=A0A916Y8J1_9FLAO|nr:alpha/beta hydrolase [Flavobacterium orientale]GGD34770.1 lipase LipA [Flavobacterium orientale]